jgi:hypothetical protein
MSERDDIVPPEIIRLTGPGTSTVPKPVDPIDRHPSMKARNRSLMGLWMRFRRPRGTSGHERRWPASRAEHAARDSATDQTHGRPRRGCPQSAATLDSNWARR